jgi:hypothetical protein
LLNAAADVKPNKSPFRSFFPSALGFAATSNQQDREDRIPHPHLLLLHLLSSSPWCFCGANNFQNHEKPGKTTWIEPEPFTNPSAEFVAST